MTFVSLRRVEVSMYTAGALLAFRCSVCGNSKAWETLKWPQQKCSRSAKCYHPLPSWCPMSFPQLMSEAHSSISDLFVVGSAGFKASEAPRHTQSRPGTFMNSQRHLGRHNNRNGCGVRYPYSSIYLFVCACRNAQTDKFVTEVATTL